MARGAGAQRTPAGIGAIPVGNNPTPTRELAECDFACPTPDLIREPIGALPDSAFDHATPTLVRVEGTAWASDALARMLVRHQLVREQGTPRISLLVGPTVLAAARWRQWVSQTSRRESDAPIWCAPEDADAAWLQRSARAALALVQRSAALPAAIACPPALAEATIRAGDDRLTTALREGWIALETARRRARPGVARSRAEESLHAALEAFPATRGLFRLNETVSVNFGNQAAEVDLLCRSAGIAIEIDGYHHFQGAAAYRRDRKKDALLQRHGLWVVRFLADDVLRDPRKAIHEVAAMLAARRKGT
jgi:very-short-patch-repair endonuclease